MVLCCNCCSCCSYCNYCSLALLVELCGYLAGVNDGLGVGTGGA